jgi:hypothetical protein
MTRKLYLAMLLALQLVLFGRVAPRLGVALHADAALGALPAGPAALAQWLGAAAAIVGVALALVFPGVALLRHQQRGSIRFIGLPRWAVGLALAGGATLAVGVLLHATLPLLPLDARLATAHIGRGAQNAGIALAAAGTLCAELLRRSVAPLRDTSASRHAERIEVTDPPELKTRFA